MQRAEAELNGAGLHLGTEVVKDRLSWYSRLTKVGICGPGTIYAGFPSAPDLKRSARHQRCRFELRRPEGALNKKNFGLGGQSDFNFLVSPVL